jgi:hypothetical protein
MPPHKPPRVIFLLLPTPSLPWSPVPSWSPPPRPAASTLSSPAPLPPHFQATPQRLNFSDAPSPKVAIEPWHPSLLPPPVLSTRKPISHRTCSCAPAPLALFTAGQPFTNVSLATFPPPNSFGPLLNQLVLLVSAKLCSLQRLTVLHTSVKH